MPVPKIVTKRRTRYNTIEQGRYQVGDASYLRVVVRDQDGKLVAMAILDPKDDRDVKATLRQFEGDFSPIPML